MTKQEAIDSLVMLFTDMQEKSKIVDYFYKVYYNITIIFSAE